MNFGDTAFGQVPFSGEAENGEIPYVVRRRGRRKALIKAIILSGCFFLFAPIGV